jgi:hypothetical protein
VTKRDHRLSVTREFDYKMLALLPVVSTLPQAANPTVADLHALTLAKSSV